MLALAAAAVLPLVLESSPPEERNLAGATAPDTPDASPDRIRITSFDGGEEPLPETGAPSGSTDPAGVVEAPAGSAGSAGDSDAAAPLAGWAVQIGSFADPDNARRLKAQVEARGYRVVVERVTSPEGKRRMRVLVGPVRTRPAAAGQLSRLQRVDSIDGFLVRYPG